MKIGIIGSAPSSIRRAPYADPSWTIWGCSPGAYPVVPRSEAWFELHRWEPGVVGKPETQKPWFSPEYCAWLAAHPCVWMTAKIPDVPNSRALPVEELTAKYGHYNFTSSIAWMMAMAINAITEYRKDSPTWSWGEHAIGLWGVDMAANDEIYSGQRSGCQFFIQLAHQLGITVVVPPESDLLRPPPLYGISESDHSQIKLLERKRELELRLSVAKQNLKNAENEIMFLNGALDDVNYFTFTWTHQGDANGAALAQIFTPTAVSDAAPADARSPSADPSSLSGDARSVPASLSEPTNGHAIPRVRAKRTRRPKTVAQLSFVPDAEELPPS